MINYVNIINNEKNEKTINPNFNFLENFYDKILSIKNEPFIFYYLSLILFLSDVTYGSSENFITKMTELFEENYTKTNLENKIFSISSMLLLTSYYLNLDKIDAEKLKRFKKWYSELTQKNSYIYFEIIYKSILEGNYEIEILIEESKNFEVKKLKDYSINFEKRKKKLSLESMILTLYAKISSYVGYKNKYDKGFKRKNNKVLKSDKQINNVYINTNETHKIEQPIKINIKSNLDINAQEIEQIKNDLNKDKYYNDYYCTLDDIQNRCFIENPKNVFIKRNFSHIFYKSLFYCKAFKKIKNIYLTLLPEANAANKQLNYPSKIKNYSDSFGPKLFLRKNFNFFNTKYFPVSHDFLTKSPPYFKIEDKNKKEKLQKLLESNISDINFYEHRFNINEILKEKDRYFDCELINPQFTYCGYMFLGNNYIYFGTKSEEHIQLVDRKSDTDFNYFSRFCFKNYDYFYNKPSKKKTIIIFYQDIKKIIKRRTFLMYQSLEIFCRSGKKFFFNLYKIENCENAFKILSSVKETLREKVKFEFITENTTKEVKKIVNEVRTEAIDNYTYLLKLNDLSSRTFNDTNQYPIFPWLFFDLNKIGDIFELEKKKIEQKYKNKKKISINPKTEIIGTVENKNKELSNEELYKIYRIRNFSYPVSLQNEENREEHISKDYEPHSKHYSTAGYTFYYLDRNYPFLETTIQLQNLKKENPNRFLTSIEDFQILIIIVI